MIVLWTVAGLGGADGRRSQDKTSLLRVVELSAPDGQILSYRHLAGSTEVYMRGTRLAPQARIKLKIGSRPGFVELDINRGGIDGLMPAWKLGRDFLTYVLWAVSVDGKASNLGEITFEGDRAVSVNLTTPYQTFWLMVTAEPNYAVVDPSPHVMLYSVKQAAGSENKALPIRGALFFFTHYATYESTPGNAPSDVPNQLLQARKAVALASSSGVLGANRTASATNDDLKEQEYTREALSQAASFLSMAEAAYQKNPKDQEVVQFARTAAQSAENARALAMGAVGGLLVRQLEREVASLREEIARLKGADGGGGPDASVLVAPSSIPSSSTTRPEPPAASDLKPAEPIHATTIPLIRQPTLWFAVGGWTLALVLLFRRRSV
jgi:hypothetical protein